MIDFKKILLRKREKPDLSTEGAVSTGSTLLNLACTDTPDLGFLKGGYYYLVGDSTSGKTWLSLTCFAEASISKAFRNHRLIFDDVEGGALMDMERYFGKAVAERIETPSISKKGVPVCSESIEDFYYNIQDVIDDGRPFIYVLDSQDALDSKAAKKKFQERKDAAESGEETTGSYGDGKAKFHSEHLRHVLSGLRKRKSILIIIGQTRDNLGRSFDKKTRSGGRALRFYARLEIWTSVLGKITKRARGKERTVGVQCLAEVKKNRVTGKIGKDRSVIVPIYYGFGIDDVGSCVDFLIEEGHWRKVKRKNDSSEAEDDGKKKRSIYDAKELLFQGTRNEIVSYVEEEGLENKVRQATAKLWQDIETECLPNRKRRYE